MQSGGGQCPVCVQVAVLENCVAAVTAELTPDRTGPYEASQSELVAS